MKTNFLKNRGFTLIELLVVVAIIGLLASVILSSLNTSRNKAKDATIKEEVHQMVGLMGLNYNDYGSYCNLNPNAWINASGVTCSTMNVSGTYASQFQAICNIIYNNAGDVLAPPTGAYRIVIATSPATCATAYSIEVALNDGQWYCSGSSGESAEYPPVPGSYPSTPLGCGGNP